VAWRAVLWPDADDEAAGHHGGGVNDRDEETAPLRIPTCTLCRQPVTDHMKGCLHFQHMTRLDRIVSLAIAARSRGTTLHWRGFLFL
jgi:hypothetical protein